jgi:peptide deformylase
MEDIKAITINDNEKYLRQISQPVKIGDKELLNDIKVLEKFCKDNEVMAMAAVQLGIPKRLIYLKNTDLKLIEKFQSGIETEEEKNYNEARILINPIVISKEGLTKYWESCASCLDNMGLVKRPYKIIVQYQDLNGKVIIDKFEGFESTVLSHELDHLDGILHIDIAEEVLVMPVEERKKFRQLHGYNLVYEHGNYDELSYIKEK